MVTAVAQTAAKALTMAVETEEGPVMQHFLEEAAALAVLGPSGSVLAAAPAMVEKSSSHLTSIH